MSVFIGNTGDIANTEITDIGDITGDGRDVKQVWIGGTKIFPRLKIGKTNLHLPFFCDGIGYNLSSFKIENLSVAQIINYRLDFLRRTDGRILLHSTNNHRTNCILFQDSSHTNLRSYIDVTINSVGPGSIDIYLAWRNLSNIDTITVKLDIISATGDALPIPTSITKTFTHN